MDNSAIQAVVDELKPLLIGRRLGKVFQLSTATFVIDFGLRSEGFLFLSVDPASPRMYLIKRRLRDIEKQSQPSGQFSLSLKKELPRAELLSIEKDERERVVRLRFLVQDELDQTLEKTLVLQLTGRAANLHLIESDGVITAQARPGRGAGQQIGEEYQPPPAARPGAGKSSNRPDLDWNGFTSISEALDAHYQQVDADHAFDSQAHAARARLRKEISSAQKLLARLRADETAHANFEEQKRIGDLLLANVGTARRNGNRVMVVDYFAEGTPELELEVDEATSLPEAAAANFARYSRSKRARLQIEKRLVLAQSDLAALETRQKQLEEIISARDEAALAAFDPKTTTSVTRGPENTKPAQRAKRIPGTRQYVSGDGLEILVGRAAHDNDNLTFKIARPNDLWLHAADYPGSHVIVRTPTRKDVPHRTLIQAAQLAAYFSQANKSPKVDVHYTPRKFVSKIRGAAPGLVRLTRQKTIAVEPVEAATRLHL